ncbi:MAG: hypothetical protein HW403_1049 [Dehalococcoidia bacterium]|nr:hypothetical protein [Dehalococcoidia bacterium]
MTNFVILGPAAGYMERGRKVIMTDPGPYVMITLLFSLTAASTAIALSVSHRDLPLLIPAMFLLDFNALLVAPVVTMMAVATGCTGQQVHLASTIKSALPWVPRYFWTNAHTTVIFWVPLLSLLFLRSLQEAHFPVADSAKEQITALWWLLTGLVGMYLHSRTLLAPYLAIHSNLPGTIATLEAWRLSSRHLPLVLVTLVICIAPVAIPLGIMRYLVTESLYNNKEALEIVNLSLPHLLLLWVQLVRLALIPPVYLLYQDLWAGEMRRRYSESEQERPFWARMLLTFTSWLPSLAPTSSGNHGGSTINLHPPVGAPSGSRLPEEL